MMAIQRDTSKAITKRVLKYMNAAIKNGQVRTQKEFAEIAGMPDTQLFDLKKHGTRYFTLDQLINLGKHFNWDMNYFIYGTGTPHLDSTKKKMPLSEQLKGLIVALDAAEAELKARNNKTEQKSKKQIK